VLLFTATTGVIDHIHDTNDKKNSVVAGPQRTRALVCVLAGLCAFTAVVWYAA